MSRGQIVDRAVGNGRNGSRLELKCCYCVLYCCYHYCKDGICYTIVKLYHLNYASSFRLICDFVCNYNFTDNTNITSRTGPLYNESITVGCVEGYAASSNITWLSTCTDGVFSELNVQCELVCEEPVNYSDRGIDVSRIFGEVKNPYSELACVM